MDINLRNRRYRELRKHLDTIDRNVLAEAMFKYFKKKVGDVLGPGTSIFGSKKLDGLLEIARGVIERLQEVPKEEKVTEKKLNEDLEILWDALRQLNDIKASLQIILSSWS
jgi:ABC-type sugar transport system substrate-binding protein